MIKNNRSTHLGFYETQIVVSKVKICVQLTKSHIFQKSFLGVKQNIFNKDTVKGNMILIQVHVLPEYVTKVLQILYSMK